MKKILLMTFLAATFGVGCDKKVEITFSNTTDKSLAVGIFGPGQGTGPIGTVAPNGGVAGTKIRINKKELPATYEWKAGEYKGKIDINRDTAKQLWVRIPGGLAGPPAGSGKKKKDKEEKKKKGDSYWSFNSSDNSPENQYNEAYNWDGTYPDAVPDWYSDSIKGLKPGVDFNRKDAD